MRHGTQLAPDGSVPNSHELARCAACESILYDVPVLLDGVRVGKVAWRCPHCHDGKPLDPAILRRQTAHLQPPEVTAAEIAAQEAFRRRAALGRETKRRSDEEHRAQVVAAIQRFARRHGRPPTAHEMGHSGPVQVPGLASRSLVARLFGSPRHALEAAGFVVAARSSGNTRKGRGMAMRRYTPNRSHAA